MLAYRHAFHAGNHADVLKHVALVAVLRHMTAKDRGLRFVDTHAGAGGYSLEGRYAKRKGEAATGIERLWARDDLPPAVADYVALVRRFNGDGPLRQYPGSPAIAQMLLRDHDEMRLSELHPTDHKILAAFLGRRPHTEVRMADGFAALKAQLPPPTRRGVVLIDPPYEIKSDYTRTLAAFREALSRFPDAVVVVWSPQLQLLEARQLPQRLKTSAEAAAKKGWLHAQLSVAAADARGFGMLGSDVVVANPPHTLRAALAAALPFLAGVLASGVEGRWNLATSAV